MGKGSVGQITWTAYNLHMYLSVSCVVHCKVGWHPSSQHPKNYSLNVNQGVGCPIWDLLKCRQNTDIDTRKKP